MDDISDDEVKLLESLVSEGLLSPGIAKRVKTAMRVGNMIGANRRKALLTYGSFLAIPCLASAATAAPFVWLQVLLGGFGVLAFGIGLSRTMP